MTDNINKLMAEALVECNHALSYEIDKREHLQHNPPIALIRYTADTDYIRVECNPFADTLESRRQLDALFFYTLFPDKQVIISGDGHFDTREQMINHVNEHFKQLAEKSHD